MRSLLPLLALALGPFAAAQPTPPTARPPERPVAPPPAPTGFDMAADPAGFRRLFYAYGERGEGRTATLDPATGLTFSLPAVKKAGHLGMRADLTVPGDFQIEARYELLAAPAAVREGGGAAVGMSLYVSPAVGGSTVSRGVFVADRNGVGPCYHTVRGVPIKEKTFYAVSDVPTTAKAGRICLRRVGSEILALAADAPSDELREIFRYPLPGGPVKSVSLFSDTGGAAVEWKARLYDVKLLKGASLPPIPPKSTATAVVRNPMPTLERAEALERLNPPTEPEEAKPAPGEPPPPAPARSTSLFIPLGIVVGIVIGVLVCRRWKAVAGAGAVLLAAGPASAQDKPPKFDMAADPAGFRKLFYDYGDRDGGRAGTFDPATGLTISLPAVKKSGHTGMQAGLSIPGDFQIEGRYELLTAPAAVPTGYGASIGLSVYVSPAVGGASVTRGVFVTDGTPGGGPGYHAGRGVPIKGKTYFAIGELASTAKAGRIGLRRVGAEVLVLAADAPGDELQEVARHPFTDQGAVTIDLFADTGRTAAELRGRLYGLRIRTGADVPTADARPAPGAEVKTRLPTPAQLTAEAALKPDPEPPLAPGEPAPAPARRQWLLPVVTLVAGLVGGVLIGRRTVRPA